MAAPVAAPAAAWPLPTSWPARPPAAAPLAAPAGFLPPLLSSAAKAAAGAKAIPANPKNTNARIKRRIRTSFECRSTTLCCGFRFRRNDTWRQSCCHLVKMIGTLRAMTDRRSILVTGAASGIGAATCRMMASPDTAILVHTRRNRDGAEAVARQVRDAGGVAAVALGDLAEPAVATALVVTAVRCFGRLDVLVSNAGFADRTGLADLTNEALVASTEAIQGAFFRLAQTALPHLRT